ncbi:MAG: hypothetical protein ACKVH0_02845 [Alphaproteobacteria bacterium]
MRLLNIIGISLTASLVVVVAFVAKTSHSAETHRMWLEGLEQPVKEMVIHRRRDGFIEEAAKYAGHKGAIGVLRNPGAPLPVNKTLAARERAAFEREIRRRFHASDRPVVGYVPPTELVPQGRMVSGFVSRVDAGGKSCDFGVAAYAAEPGLVEIVAVARVILCDAAGQLTTPNIRLGALLAHADAPQ